MATYHAAGTVLSASEVNQTVQATQASSTNQAHCLQADEDSFTITAGATDNGTVTFGTPFAAAPIVMTTIDAASSAGTFNGLRTHIHTVTTTSFGWRVNVVDGSTPTVTGALAWMAFGQVSA